MEASAYFPIATGLLRAYAETREKIKNNYEFQPFLYHIDSPINILEQYRDPDVAAFSVSMWNERLAHTVASEVKRRWPRCLIVMGGPQVPQSPHEYFLLHPWLDVAVRAEGEEAFAHILERNLESRDFSGIANLAWRREGACIKNPEEAHQPKDLDLYPSPYLEGYFDEIMETSVFEMQATIETNRGCPFPCSFCLAEGTIIDIIGGRKRIEDIGRGDLVWGFDEVAQAVSCNRIERVICTGEKETLRIAVSGLFINATEDHQFLTPNGWKRARELAPQDSVLCDLREIVRSIEEGQEILFESLLAQIGCETQDDSSGISGREIQCSDEEKFGTHENKQSDEASGSSLPASENDGCGIRQREMRSVHVNAGGSQADWRDCQSQGVRAGQSDAEPGNDEKKFGEGACSSQSIREARFGFPFFASIPLQVHGGRFILDRPLPIRRAPQSGLRELEKETGNIGPRETLASRSGQGREGIGRLSNDGMALSGYLGQRQAGRGNAEEYRGVCWARIDSIISAGRKRVYDLVNVTPYPNFFANGILAHNCYWGQGGLSRKYRFHGIERVKLEIEWAAKNRIKYLFNADSNFGMHKRDEEITDILVSTKSRYGFPEKFRTCFGKNSDERIYEIARKLHDADMEKGITLALQSNTPIVLKNIQRTNIKMETYQYLQRKFNQSNVPVYSEMISGMPGETYDTWKEGIEALLQAGLQNQLFVYLCQILPNTEMSEPEYQKKHGIVSHRIELNEIHGAIRTDDLVTEYEDIIVQTDSMSLPMWRKMLKFSWMTMTLHSLKLGFFVMLWLNKKFGVKFTDFIEYLCEPDHAYVLLHTTVGEFRNKIDKLLNGYGRGRIMMDYGPVYWDEEEAAFLRNAEMSKEFYDEMRDITRDFLMSHNIDYDYSELNEVLAYQRLRIPRFGQKDFEVRAFGFNLPEYFEKILTKNINIERRPQIMTVCGRQFDTRAEFAKETIMWGRKSGTIMNKVDWKYPHKASA